jgi:hypothetical protein
MHAVHVHTMCMPCTAQVSDCPLGSAMVCAVRCEPGFAGNGVALYHIEPNSAGLWLCPTEECNAQLSHAGIQGFGDALFASLLCPTTLHLTLFG